MADCAQCGKPAIVSYADGVKYCVEHHLMMQQAFYLTNSMLSASLNEIRGNIELGVGLPGLLPRVEIPPPPFAGQTLTLNNINVTGSTVGAINTGTIQQLDTTITLMRGGGESDLAESVKELTEAIIRTDQLGESTKNELAEQLAFLGSQVTAKQDQRSPSLAKPILVVRNL